MGLPGDVEYTVSASDTIIAVNDEWTAFAASNDGGALLPPTVLGRSLWDFIADRTTILIYRRLFERIRAGAEPVRFGFRCDAPALRRWLEMSIVTQAAGALCLVVRSRRLEDRPPLPLLDPAVKRSDAVLRMCGWCKRIPAPSGRWMEIEAALPHLGLFEQEVLPAISHGICDACHRVMTTMAGDPMAPEGASDVGAAPRLRDRQ